MKKITILFVAIMIASCEYNPQPTGNTSKTSLGDYDVKVIDECEYIEYSQGLGESRVYSITHKGNCKFCAKRRGQLSL